MRLVEYVRSAGQRHQTRQVEQRGEALAANRVLWYGNEPGSKRSAIQRPLDVVESAEMVQVGVLEPALDTRRYNHTSV